MSRGDAALNRSLSTIALAALASLAAMSFALRARSARDLQQSTNSGAPLALIGERIFVSPFAKPIADGAILIENGEITAVGRKSNISFPEGTSYLDCTGLFVTAGFQNSHVHFTEPKWANAAQLPAAKLSEQLQQMLTRYGFTTVVDTGSSIENTAALRMRIESGEITGPRILTAGSPLYPPNGIPYYLKDAMPADQLKLLSQPATPTEAVKLVDDRVVGGADIIKLFTGSWVSKGQVATMPLPIAQAAVAEAHKHGKLVFAHPSNLAGFQVALQAHVDVLAHAVEDTSGWNKSYPRQMQAGQMWLIPTLSLFMDDSNYADILAEVQGYSQDHERILFGTDVGFRTDYDPSSEYAEMARAGMDFLHILDTLTTAPAIRFGESKRRGEIKVGMDADLVVLGGNPEQDIRHLARVNFAFRKGQVIYSIANQ